MRTDCPKVNSTENMLQETLKVFDFAVHNLALLTITSFLPKTWITDKEDAYIIFFC